MATSSDHSMHSMSVGGITGNWKQWKWKPETENINGQILKATFFSWPKTVMRLQN